VTRVVVHPASDLQYASFLLEGLAQVLGPSSIGFGSAGFDPKYRGGRVLAFYLVDDPNARCFVSLHDHSRVNAMGLRWGRSYGMVNVSRADLEQHPNLLAIGPTFGVRLRSQLLTARHMLHAARWRGLRGARSTVSDVHSVSKYLRRRTTIDRYTPHDSDPDYVFFAASAWAKHPEVNPPRTRFVEVCTAARGLTFEGGFSPHLEGDLPELTRFPAPRRYGIDDYIDKLSRSVVAFNSPAVHGCLGWKLGEFLALGKAIITLPLSLALPAELEDGVHVHVVSGSQESIEDALERLRRDGPYRSALQSNARRWYEEHLAPAHVARRLLRSLATPDV
jgi:hypothetical protein